MYILLNLLPPVYALRWQRSIAVSIKIISKKELKIKVMLIVQFINNTKI